MNYTVVINMAIWGGAMLYYYIDARKWFKGPKITLDVETLTEDQQRALADEGLEIEGLHEALVEGQHKDVGAGEGS